MLHVAFVPFLFVLLSPVLLHSVFLALVLFAFTPSVLASCCARYSNNSWEGNGCWILSVFLPIPGFRVTKTTCVTP